MKEGDLSEAEHEALQRTLSVENGEERGLSLGGNVFICPCALTRVHTHAHARAHTHPPRPGTPGCIQNFLPVTSLLLVLLSFLWL